MSGNNSRSNRRREMDVMKLMKSPRRVVYPSDNVSEFWVEFEGPEGTPYEDGVWVLHVTLPEEYPFRSPSIGFSNRILHPNVDETSGTVCLDVINQTWTPMYELENIFDVFLPQLLRYPNPADPLNPTAASLMQSDPIGYVTLLQEHAAQYATRERALACIPVPYGPISNGSSNCGDVEANRVDMLNGNGTSGGVVNGNGTADHSANSNGHAPPLYVEVNGDFTNGAGGVMSAAAAAVMDLPTDEEYVPDEIEL